MLHQTEPVMQHQRMNASCVQSIDSEHPRKRTGTIATPLAQPSLTIHVGTLTASHTWTKVDLHGPIGPRTTALRPSFRTAREPALRT